jgi:hypothetical protein
VTDDFFSEETSRGPRLIRFVVEQTGPSEKVRFFQAAKVLNLLTSAKVREFGPGPSYQLLRFIYSTTPPRQLKICAFYYWTAR